MENHVQNGEYEEAFAIANQMNLELIFLNKVASPVYTGRTITGEDGANGGNEPINIILVDSKTCQRVTSGQAASLKVKIVLVRAEFCCLNENKGIWTPQEFKNNIVINFGKKKNLLLGDLSLVLKGGSGTLGEIRIKHDGNPIRNVKFRLGAMVDGDCPYEIKEAITYPFDVKDRRNECKGTGPLLLNDMVWKIVNIAKKGPIRRRLERKNVETVGNFLDMYISNPQELKEICGMKGKKWDMAVSHAKTSLKNNMCNAYGRVGSTSQQSNCIPFDCDDFKLDYDGSQLCVKDVLGNLLKIDYNFSIEDVGGGDVVFLGFESYQDHQESGVNGALKLDPNGVGLAKKRWMKLRATLWFSMVSSV